MKLTKEENREMWRHFDILFELWNTAHLVKDGLAILQRSKASNDNHHSFILLIATGLERLYKLILTLESYETKGQFLYRKELKNHNHDLVKLNALVLSISKKHAEIDTAALELPVHLDLLSILRDFLGNSRYLLLDNLNDPLELREKEPSKRWNKLGFDSDQNHQRSVVMVEKITQTLCRLLNDVYLNGKINAGSPMLWTLLSSAPGTRVYNQIE